MAVGDVFRMVRKVELNGNAHYNVLHFIQTQVTTPEEEQSLVDGWDNEASITCPEHKLAAMQKGYGTLSKVSFDVQKILPTEGEVQVFPFKTRTTFGPDQGLPSYAAVKMLFATDLNSRSGKGGFFVGGIDEASTSNDLLNTAGEILVNDLLTALEDFCVEGGASYIGYHIGVWSRLLNQFNPATSLGYSPLLSTQRSRRAGRGI